MPKYDLQSQFSMNSPNIVGEKFDEEVVLVNLNSGIYFSLRENAAKIWTLLTMGYSASQIIALYQQYCSEVSDAIAGQISEFIEQLIDHDLLVTSNRDLVEVEEPFLQSIGLFTTPTLEIFSDMQDILLLDPVHDVDERGWPINKNNSA
jgi:hypothetical protein